MNTSPKRVDWRGHVRGLPLAAISEEGIKQLAQEQYEAHLARINRATDREIDEACRSAVERISDRPGPNRWSE